MMNAGEPLHDMARLRFWKDGAVVPSHTEGISIWDHGFLYGDGIFEGIRVYRSRVYRYHEHIQRLRRGSRIMALGVRYCNDEIREAVATTMAANSLSDAHVRILLTRGVGVPTLDPKSARKSCLFVIAYPLSPTLGAGPVSVVISSVARKAPRSVDASVKSLNYVDSILARLQATAAGADDAILLDGQGSLAEATGANIFLVENGRLRTLGCTAALPGITRRAVLELARQHEIVSEVGQITPGELYAADEAFLTRTGAGIVGIRSVDGRVLAAAPGPVTLRLQDSYRLTWESPEYSELL